MGQGTKKRKAESTPREEGSNKKSTGKKKWVMPRREVGGPREVEPGDMGIWATCSRSKEAPTVTDLYDLFRQYALQLYGVDQAGGADEADGSDEDGDIESNIQKEIEEIRRPRTEPLFRSAKLDTACLTFFKTRAPVEPVSFVHRICEDAAKGVEQKLCRFVRRLTPITATEKATDKGIEDVARQVIGPHFHAPDQTGKKFAIRVSIRNNKQIKRDEVIEKVATIVGDKHTVDLSGYDSLILVEIYQNIVGMSIVGSDFDQLKRYNLAELRDAFNEKSKEETNAAAENQAKELSKDA